MRRIDPTELTNREYIWIASVGEHINAHPYRWTGFMLPTKMMIVDLKFTKPPPNRSYTFHNEHIEFKVDGLEGEFKYMVTPDGFIESTYNHIIGFEYDNVYELWIKNIRLILRDTWAGINGVKSNDALKEYIVDKQFDFFNKDHPEFLI